MTIRFENGIVVTLGSENRVLWNSTVVTDGEQIVAVGDAAAMRAQYPAAESVDCAGKIVLPGFICAHHHFYSTMARGMGIPGEPASNFVEILERLWWKVDRALEEEDIASVIEEWLPAVQNDDGGFGKAVDTPSDPGTTALVLLAFSNRL